MNIRKAYRMVMLDGRGGWESRPRETIIAVTGQEWVAETFAVVIKAFDPGKDQAPGITIKIQGQDARDRWWDMAQDEVQEFLELV